MLRKGTSVSNIIGIGSSNNSTPPGTINTTSATTGLLSSSATSSPSHYHQSHHRQQYRSSSNSRGDRESLAHHQHHRTSQQPYHNRSTPPSSSAILEGGPNSTLPKRGNSHSHSTSDINSAVGGCGGISGNRSPSRSHHHRNQDHCCGCACSSISSNNLATLNNKGSPSDGLIRGSSNSSTLLRHVVSNNIPRSPRAGSPQLVLCTTSPYHSPAQLLLNAPNNRDCSADSHPRLTTNPNHNIISGTNNKIWLFGKDEEDDDEYGQDDEGDEERRDAPVPILHRRSAGVNSVSAASVGGGLLGVGSTSHGYSHHLHHHQQQHTPTHNPSPVIVTASVPSQGGGPPGLSSAQYNAGASTSTPTNNAAGFNNPLFKLQNSSSSPSTVVATPPELLLPMDFIQVLIHQHAKTIVALQDLQKEVSTLSTQTAVLKDFRTSLLQSLPATGAPTAPGSNGLSEAVWTTGGGGAVGGTPVPAVTTSSSSSNGATTTPKIPHPDSGFSTETKSTNQKSDAESDDELYSLLSLIQCKVQESIIRNDYFSHQQQRSTVPTTAGFSTGRSRRKSDNSKAKERLGKLDKVLGNCDTVEFRKDFISRDVIRGVLSAEKTELQRQLFFALVKIENLKSLTKEQKTIDSRVHALSQENEQLRYKLKEMEIELEGTKANLRILQKSSYPSVLLLPNKTSPASACSSANTAVLPEASCHSPSTVTNHPHPASRLVMMPPVPPTSTWDTDSLDNTDPADFAIPGATAPVVVASTPAVVASSSNAPVSSASTTTRQRLIQKLTDIESVSNSSSSVGTAVAAANNNSTIRLSTNNNYSYGSSSNQQHGSSSSKKSPAPKPPVIIENAATTSPPSSNNNNNNNTISKQQQKSASPVGNKSMSSIKSNNSSIPIAVSRLKNKGTAAGSASASANSSPNNMGPNNIASNAKTITGKAKSGGAGAGNGSGNNENGGTFWANWFRS